MAHQMLLQMKPALPSQYKVHMARAKIQSQGLKWGCYKFHGYKMVQLTLNFKKSVNSSKQR